jgi:GNAT superfamily N-acetyltransferase
VAEATDFAVRDAQVEELAQLPAVERAAATVLAGLGVDAVVDAEPNDVATFRRWLDGEGLLVAVVGGAPVGFAGLDVVDDEAHLAEIDVLPDRQGRGIGQALLDAACQRARDRGHAAMTLTTFRDVPWNGPWYRRNGFVVVDGAAQGTELRAIRAKETARGFDALPRVAMRLDLR